MSIAPALSSDAPRDGRPAPSAPLKTAATCGQAPAGSTIEALFGGGLLVTVPAGARVVPLSVDMTSIYLSPICPGTDDWSRRACVSVVVRQAQGSAPKTLAEATARWDAESQSHSWGGTAPPSGLGEGVTAGGVMHATRGFDVRVGFSDGRGRTIHHYQGVSRVYAALPWDETRHVACTGYVEHRVEPQGDPDIEMVRAVCTSLCRSR